MRWPGGLVLLLLPAVLLAAPPDPLDTAVRLANSDAPQLALSRVERLQPDPGHPRWAEWEQVRILLLAQLKQDDALLRRVEALPADSSEALVRAAWIEAARAALRLEQGPRARAYLGRVLWKLGLTEQDFRQARRLVIDSYLAEGRGEDAYHAMLRFQQDFAPLEKAEAERFVSGLLAAGRDRDALNWLGDLDDASPTRLMLRLKAGLIAPDAARSAARANLEAKPILWGVVAEAARMEGDAPARVEALEQLLAADAGDAAAADALWAAYEEHGRALANQNQLLVGDDAAWLSLAARIAESNQAAARAVYAALSRSARAPVSRGLAEDKLAASLLARNLNKVALAVFARLPAQRLTSTTRYLLGSAAARGADYRLAARYWKGLSVLPEGMDASEWQLRQAEVLAYAGSLADAALALRPLVAAGVLSRGSLQRIIPVAREMVEARQPNIAMPLLSQLLPLAEPPEQRELYLLLGQAAEVRGDFRLAAENYLYAATTLNGSDAFSQDARQRAAESLVRGGLRDDARVQWERLLKLAKDPERQQAIRRELGRL